MAVFADNFGAELKDCEFYGNVGTNVAGIVYLRRGTMERCKVRGNRLWAHGESGGWDWATHLGLGSVVAGRHDSYSANDAVQGVVRDCEISGNVGEGSHFAGCGLWCYGVVRAERLRIMRNRVESWQDKHACMGVAMNGVKLELRDTEVAENGSDKMLHGWGTLGLYCGKGETVASNCVFRDSAVRKVRLREADPAAPNEWNGNHMYGVVNAAEGAKLLMRESAVTGHWTVGKGLVILQGAESEARSKVLRNCLVAGNNLSETAWRVPLVMVGGGHAALENCTIADNVLPNREGEAVGFGAGDENHKVTPAAGGRVVNCVIWNNETSGNGKHDRVFTPEGREDWKHGFRHCFVKEGSGALAGYGVGNLEGVVAFRDAAGGDYRAAGGRSAVVDRGELLEWMAPKGAVDLAGLARVSGEGPDIGAYEHQAMRGMRIILR